MATLTGFQTASQSEIESANKSNSIARGNSPFQHNVVFTVSGFSYEKAEVDGKVAADANLNPVLVTSVGSLFLNTLVRGRVNADGKVVEPNGTFNNDVRATIAANASKTNGEILQAIVNLCVGKRLIVNREPYSAATKDGRRYAAYLVNIDYVND